VSSASFDWLLLSYSNMVSCLWHLALLKRQGLDVKGLLKADPVKEEPQSYIDCTGHLQVLKYSTSFA
jgi:hypothetical protein